MDIKALPLLGTIFMWHQKVYAPKFKKREGISKNMA